jgi:photosystem II stability/assembly factor-like uncharacterized protein
MFVAVGNSGTILTSPDGSNWTSRTSNTSNLLEGIIYGNGQFIAVGNNGTILTSTDGATWNSSTVTPSGILSTTELLESISYDGSSKFVVIGETELTNL